MKITRKSDSQIMHSFYKWRTKYSGMDGQIQSLATECEWMWLYNNEWPHCSIGGIPSRRLLEAI
jgi:hypothetical protein